MLSRLSSYCNSWHGRDKGPRGLGLRWSDLLWTKLPTPFKPRLSGFLKSCHFSSSILARTHPYLGGSSSEFLH